VLDDQSVGFVWAISYLARFDFDWLWDVLVTPREWDLRILFLAGVLEAEGEGDFGEVLVGVGHAQRIRNAYPVARIILRIAHFFFGGRIPA
jgi:hypothetical protein